MIKELNEKIQRLRDVLVTCYKAIKEKGGTIPEAGERNMTNLPAAVYSLNTIKTSGCILKESVPEEYIDILVGNKSIVEYDDEKMQKFSGIYSYAPLEYIMPEAKRIYLPHVIIANVNGGMFRNLVYLEELNIPNLTSCQFHTNFGNLTSVQYISLPSLEVFVGNSNFVGCTNLIECDLPRWNGSGAAAMFIGCTKLERLKTGKLVIGFTTNQWLHQSPNFIDLEIGEGTDVDINLSTMNPSNVLADQNKLSMFNANIRNHIASKISGQHTIVLHPNVKSALEDETINAFINKGWTIA